MFKFSEQTQQNHAPPQIKPFEFEPFKFQIEKDELMYGYTMEELYGRRYGVKHSEALQREIRKDSILFALFLLGSFTFLFKSRQDHYQMKKDWDTYIYHNMGKVRPIPQKSD